MADGHLFSWLRKTYPLDDWSAAVVLSLRKTWCEKHMAAVLAQNKVLGDIGLAPSVTSKVPRLRA